MYIQHHQNPATNKDLVNSAHDAFELIVLNKTTHVIVGKIYFEYLGQSFDCDIQLTPSSLQLRSVFPFKGIISIAPAITFANFSKDRYIDKEGLVTSNGHQHIIWLILDQIHLYNVFRLKAKLIVEVYRDTFQKMKTTSTQINFGEIDASTKEGNEFSQLLHRQCKLVFKYHYGNEKALLDSVQSFLKNTSDTHLSELNQQEI